MSEIEHIQSSEEIESGAEVEAARELDEITHEPGSSIENKGSVEQSEAIEITLKESVDSSPETKAGGKFDDSQGKYEEPLKELDQELPHQEKLGHQEQLPEGMPGHEGMPGMDDMPGSEYPGMENMPGGKNLPGSDMTGSDIPGSDIPGSDLPGSDMPGSDLPGMDGLPGSDVLGGYKPDGDDMPGGLPGRDLPSKSGIPGEGGGIPKPPSIYETDGGGTDDQKGDSSEEESGQKTTQGPAMVIDTRTGGADGTPVDAGIVTVDTQTGEATYSTTESYLQRAQELHDMDISRAVDGKTSDETEEGGGERIPPDAIEVRPGMIPGEEITDPPHPDMADSGDEMSKPGVYEATTVDPNSSGGRVPPEAIKVRPGMIPGEEITDPPNPDLTGKSSEDAMAAQKGADVKTIDSDQKEAREGNKEVGKKGAG